MSKGPRRILVVEDDQAIRETLSELLTAEGYAVEVAANGHLALDLLKTNPSFPGLILLDLSMPIMDGPAFLAEIGKSFASVTLPPILVMTAAGPEKISTLRDRVSFIRKPLDIDDLLGKIVKYFE